MKVVSKTFVIAAVLLSSLAGFANDNMGAAQVASGGPSSNPVKNALSVEGGATFIEYINCSFVSSPTNHIIVLRQMNARDFASLVFMNVGPMSQHVALSANVIEQGSTIDVKTSNNEEFKLDLSQKDANGNIPSTLSAGVPVSCKVNDQF